MPTWPPLNNPLLAALLGALFAYALNTIFRRTGKRADWFDNHDSRLRDLEYALRDVQGKAADLSALTTRLREVEYGLRDTQELRRRALEDLHRLQETATALEHKVGLNEQRLGALGATAQDLQKQYWEIQVRLTRTEEGMLAMKKVIDDQVIPLLQAKLQQRLRS